MSSLLPVYCSDLLRAVREGLSKRGFHFLSTDDLQRLLERESRHKARMSLLEDFAAQCGARVETDPRLSTARLAPEERPSPGAPGPRRRCGL